MSNSKKEKKSIGLLKWVIPGLALMAYLCVTMYGYYNTMMSNSEANAIDKVLKQAVMISSYYDGVLDSKISMARAVAGYCVQDEDIFDEKNIEYISSLKSSLNLNEVYLVKSGGDAMSSDGQIHKESFSDPMYEGILGEADSVLAKTADNGEVYLLIAAPIRTDYERKGTVVFELKAREIEKVIDTPSYNYSMIDNTGIIADHLETGSDFFTIGTNVFEQMGGYRYVRNNSDMMRKNMSVGKSGYIEIASPQGDNRVIVYQPLKNYPCSILIAVNTLAIERSANDENAATRDIIMKILFSVGIFLGLIIMIYLVSKVASTKENRELQNKAETDLLTDLYNKMSTERKIREYLDGEGRGKTNMMCVLDVDNFKKINDTMGHAFGDEVLSTLGKRLKSEFRVTDIIGRMGGDEFVIFLKDVKDDTIISREANRVEEFFKNFQVGQYTKYSATASIGVSIYPKDAQDYDSLFKAADSALYTSKKRGKNQLSFYGDGIIEKDDDEDEDEDDDE